MIDDRVMIVCNRNHYVRKLSYLTAQAEPISASAFTSPTAYPVLSAHS